jgi:hypothetical protein
VSQRRYDIHGLAEIVIMPRVRPEIVREIEFQIGPFRTDSPARDEHRPRILLQPYDEFSADDAEGRSAAIFYNCQGGTGSYLKDESGRLVVKQDEAGFRVFADYANVLINLYLQVLIARQGFSMVHAAAYKKPEGNVTVLAGAGGIGKTAVLGYAVRERGLQHLGDDVVILSGDGRCLSFPRAFVLKSYHREGYADTFRRLRLPRWNLYSAKRFLIDNAPLVGLTKSLLRRSGLYYKVADALRPQPFLATVSPEELFGQNSIASDGQIARIAYMDRTEGHTFEIRPISRDALVNRLFAVIHYEWKDFLTHLVSLGALDVVDLPRYCEQVTSTLKSAVADKELLQVDIPEKATPDRLVAFLDKQGFF